MSKKLTVTTLTLVIEKQITAIDNNMNILPKNDVDNTIDRKCGRCVCIHRISYKRKGLLLKKLESFPHTGKNSFFQFIHQIIMCIKNLLIRFKKVHF